MNEGEAKILDSTGRVLGARALATRQSLLDETRRLLETQSLGELRVAEVARRAGTSPATFYQYFKDVESAVLCLVERATSEMPAIVDLISGEWRGEAGLALGRKIAEAFVRHWDEHGATLRQRNAASDDRNPAFQEIRNRAMAPIMLALANSIERHRPELAKTGESAVAAAGALAAVLERLAAYHHELERFDVTRTQLIETMARIVQRTITNEA
jgi:AcrR family transcriptional regulator